MKGDLASTLLLLLLVSWASWGEIGDMTFGMCMVALVSLSGLVANQTSRVGVPAGQLFPGVLMGVTVPASLLHLHALSARTFALADSEMPYYRNPHLLKMAHTREKAVLPYIVCLLWLLFNSSSFSVEKSAFVSAILAVVVYALDLNMQWVLLLTVICHAVNNALSHVIASGSLQFELFLLYSAIGVMIDNILRNQAAESTAIFRAQTMLIVVSIGILSTISYGALITNLLRCFPRLFVRTNSNSAVQQSRLLYTTVGLALSLLAFVVIVLQAIGRYLQRNAVFWVIDVVVADSRENAFLCFFWICCVGISLGLSLKAKTIWRWTIISTRKIFHALATVMFAPAVLYSTSCTEFVALAFGVALCAFLLIEFARVSIAVTGKLPPFLAGAFSFLDLFLKVQRSEDSAGIVLDHVTLLVACALPVWIAISLPLRSDTEPNLLPDMPLLPFLGCLSVGVGDAVGAVAGINYGRRRWSEGSGRSLEGSVAAFMSMVVVGALILAVVAFMNPAKLNWSGEMAVGVLTAVFVTVVEAVTSKNDNIVLALYSVSFYQALCFMFASRSTKL